LILKTPYNCDIKCLRCLKIDCIASQCPNKRAMILRDHWEVETKSGSNDKEMPPLKNVGDNDVKYLVEGELLVMVQNKCLGQRG